MSENVIMSKLGALFIDHDPNRLPQRDEISGLGQGIEHPVCKTRMMITDAHSKSGRLVWLHDFENEVLFLIEICHNNQRDNHDKGRIRKAYKEFLEEIYA